MKRKTLRAAVNRFQGPADVTGRDTVGLPALALALSRRLALAPFHDAALQQQQQRAIKKKKVEAAAPAATNPTKFRTQLNPAPTPSGAAAASLKSSPPPPPPPRRTCSCLRRRRGEQEAVPAPLTEPAPAVPPEEREREVCFLLLRRSRFEFDPVRFALRLPRASAVGPS
jgi:hypothetical protein